jgi:hypothetical protein
MKETFEERFLRKYEEVLPKIPGQIITDYIDPLLSVDRQAHFNVISFLINVYQDGYTLEETEYTLTKECADISSSIHQRKIRKDQ